MKQKLFTLFFALVASVGTMFAAVVIDGIAYNLNDETFTAEVTNGDAYGDAYTGEVVIPSSITYNQQVYSVTSIGEFAFSFCSGLTSITIPSSVTSIGNFAFQYCTGLTSIEIPSSVNSIGKLVFSHCANLSSILVNGQNTVYDSRNNCNAIIMTATNTLLVGSNNTVIPNNVTDIGEYAFCGYSNLKSISIPDNVISIGEWAFVECYALTSISIGTDVTNIGEGAFSYCKDLKRITNHSVNPQGIDDVFYGVDKSVCILCVPEVSLSKYKAANGWREFKNIRSIGIIASGTCGKNGDNLTWVLYSDDTFTISGTGEMANFSIGTAPWYSYRSSIAEVSMDNGVASIGNYAFSGCTGLTSVTLGNSVTSIGNDAFFCCTGLTSITIPNSVTSIGYEAFYGCRNLTSVTIPNSVTSIGYKAFYGCSGLTSVTIPNSVTSIGGSAFYNCKGLTSVTIGNSVTSIGYYAFSACSVLTSITVEGGNPMYDSRNNCNALIETATNTLLFGCQNTVIPNSVTSIGEAAFYNCSGLTSVTIPNSVTSIGNNAFSDCTGLTSVTIPNSVTSIGKDAFDNCSGLKEVHITDLAKWCAISFGSSTANPLYYAHNLYLNNEQITNLVIPNSVTSIGSHAFENCKGLTSVTIPNSVTSIGNSAFYNCSNLIIIYEKATTPPAISSHTFGNIHSDAVVYVPFGGMKNYSTAAYWQDMKLMCNVALNQEITYSPTSCTIAFEVEDVDLQSCGIEDGEVFAGNTLEYIGLEPENEYKDIPVILTSTTGVTEIVNVSFSTSALVLTTQESKPISSNTAILLAETNMAEIETSCGFEWKRNDAPEDMTPNKVFCPVANGLMAGRLKGLKEDVYYKYRAFYQSAAGNMYYGDWKYIFTGDVAVEFDPILYTYAAIAVKENEATLKGYALAGSEDFTEQGFEYWAESRANNAPRRTAASIGEHKTVTASGISMKATLTDLDPGTVYRYRSYANIGSKRLYGSEMTLTTQGEYKDPQAIEDIRIDAPQATKILHNGTLYIIRDGKTYTVQGTLVK